MEGLTRSRDTARSKEQAWRAARSVRRDRTPRLGATDNRGRADDHDLDTFFQLVNPVENVTQQGNNVSWNLAFSLVPAGGVVNDIYLALVPKTLSVCITPNGPLQSGPPALAIQQPVYSDVANIQRYPNGMVVALLLLLLFGFASAQTNEDARALLHAIASSSRTAKSWSAEGVQVSDLSGQGAQVHQETHFKVGFVPPSKMYLEIKTKETLGGISLTPPSGTLMVCDGADHWTHFSPSTLFSRAPVGVSACRPEFGDFSGIEENVLSATRIGRDHVQFSGKTTECELLRVEYSSSNSPDRSNITLSVRTLCVDPVRHFVLRDVTEGGNPSHRPLETTTYTAYTRDTTLLPDRFRFHVPTGYFQDDTHEQEQTVSNGVYTVGMLSSIPTLTSMIEPSPTAEAVRAGVSGIVLVSLQVSTGGVPENLKVVRGLGFGLDERALECVRRWRFSPGTKDGAPVAVGPLKVAVSFP